MNQNEMIEKIFEHASASEAGDYYQVSFDDDDDPGSIDGRYLLIQRQFEFPDDDSYYLESDDSRLCGHVKVRAATLSSEFLSIDLLADHCTTVKIRYGISKDDLEEFERIVGIMFEGNVFRSTKRLGSWAVPPWREVRVRCESAHGLTLDAAERAQASSYGSVRRARAR